MKAVVAIALYVSVVIFASASPSEQKSKNCNEVRTAYSSKGFNSNDVPNKGVYGKSYTRPFSFNFPASQRKLTLNTFITLATELSALTTMNGGVYSSSFCSL